MFEDTITNRVAKVIAEALDFMLHRQDIIDNTGLTSRQVKDALYRMKKRGIITNPERGFWRIREIYRKIRHTIRIIETRQARKKRDWNCDCEATCEGFVPYLGQPAPPSLPNDRVTTAIGNRLTPLLKSTMLEVLGKQGIFLTDDWVEVEPTCQPHYFHVPRFCIEGTQWLDDLSGKYESLFDCEIAFMNDIGELYNWGAVMAVSEGEVTI